MSDTARLAAPGPSAKPSAMGHKRAEAETHAPYEAEGDAAAASHPSATSSTTASLAPTTGWHAHETMTGTSFTEPSTAGEPTAVAPHTREHRPAEPHLAVLPQSSNISGGRGAPSIGPSSAARPRPSSLSSARAQAEGPNISGAGGPGRHVDPLGAVSAVAFPPPDASHSASASTAVATTLHTTEASAPSSSSSPLMTSGPSGLILQNSTDPTSVAVAAAAAPSSIPPTLSSSSNGGAAGLSSSSGLGRLTFSNSVPPPPLQPGKPAAASTAAATLTALPPMPPPPPPLRTDTSNTNANVSPALEREKTRRSSDPYTRPAVALSTNLLELYKVVNAQYCAQRRLESPGPKYNNGYDDKDGHYLFLPGEVVFQRYIAQEVLGKGSFGTVIRGFDQKRSEAVAMKITRRGSSFRSQAKLELDILLRLNENPALNHLVVRLLKVFEWQGHLVLVFELLSFNLYQLIKCTRFNGVSLDLVRKFAYQLTHTLWQLESQKPHPIIHCDLKPENILLRNQNRSGIRLIDFGSACYTAKRFHRYIQSRFYRSPEVILFLEYGTAIDRWSLACVLVELHTGVPLFDGRTEAAQLAKFECTLGPMPAEMIAASPKANRFYYGSLAAGFQLKEPVPERRTLESVIGVTTGGPRGRRLDTPGHDEKAYREFHDFVARFLRYQPEDRMSCRDALQHPFLMPLYTSDLLQQQEREAQHRQQGSAQHPQPTAAATAAAAPVARPASKPSSAAPPAITAEETSGFPS